jgi:hypothetical protein
LEKAPGTAELLNWLMAMVRFGAQSGTGLPSQREVADRTLSALLKTDLDQRRGKALLWNDGNAGAQRDGR